MKRFTVPALLAFVAALAILAGAACGDDDGSISTSGTPIARPTFAPDSTMAKIKTRGLLRVGVKYDQPGFGLVDPITGKPDGLDVAVAKEIAKALGLGEQQIEFVETITANRIPYILEDKVDLVVATMTINAERKTQIDFSRPYYLAGQSILVMKDDNSIAKVQDLNGRKTCSVRGSTSETNVKARAPGTELLSLTTYSACVSSLKEGKVDAVTTDDIILAGFAAADPDLKLVGGTFTKEAYGIGMPKGAGDFVEFVDGVIAAMFQDGRWDAIYSRYLGKVAGLPKPAEARAAIPPTN